MSHKAHEQEPEARKRRPTKEQRKKRTSEKAVGIFSTA
ncbi:hypothetical protein B4123_0508 [Bacillus paralicheniformis]|nr:hypothetical protein LI6934_12040 [Bacillus licheniformis LMG 6934]OLG11140.1 hypothetical protein B4123_2572 [Bacillus paralicheniformis]OLG13086.1 hypothetical protein B4123_0508 [Bacillus paralicheniformis]TWJ52166.1 hypothetical protein CHCC5023_4287 [Bacillus paralicheniformis]TWJ70735.1 hypothetical protein CHCC5019_3796 [Bacillus paralicheniformis]